MSKLTPKDLSLIKLFLAASWHQWQALPTLGQACYDAQCNVAEMRGCIRHLVTVAGYAPALSATKHLYNAQLLPADVPGKSGGPPGNAFELVYTKVTDAVRKAVRKVDPVLADWIRTHLYGDIYSSPGLDLSQKQLLMVAFLSQADMPDELFGHALAGMRFGLTPDVCRQALNLSFELKHSMMSSLAQQEAQQAQQQAQRSLQKAIDRYQQKHSSERQAPHITIPEPSSVWLPPLPPRFVSSHSEK